MKRGGGRRYYRPEDIDLLRGIRHLLYGDGYTIRGVQRILREQGVRTVQSVGQGKPANLPVLRRDDAHDADGEPNGAQNVLKFLSPMNSEVSDETEDAIEELEPDEPVTPAIATRPSAAANSVATTSKALETPQAHQASLPVAAPTPTGMSAEDLDRLTRALAELEACRRLLDKANEGGR